MHSLLLVQVELNGAWVLEVTQVILIEGEIIQSIVLLALA